MESNPKMPRIGTLVGSHPSPLPSRLSDDIFFEILARVRVRDLIRYKLVCKQWRDWISSKSFQNHHLQESIRRRAAGYRLITVTGQPNHNFRSYSVEGIYANPQRVESEELGHPLKDPFTCDWIVGSCNGLLCLRFQINLIYLWNPCTRESRKLPSMCLTNGLCRRPGAYVVHGFGYDERSADYKVLVIICAPKMWSYETQVLLYSVKTDAWKSLDPFPTCGPYEVPGRLLNGALHWAVPCSSIGAGFSKFLCIAAFDLETERFREVLLPDENSKLSYGSLWVLGDCLCIVCIHAENNGRLSLLVLKEYGVKESWTVFFRMHLLRPPTVLTPVCSMKDEVLLLLDQKVLLVDERNLRARCPRIKNLLHSLEHTSTLRVSFRHCKLRVEIFRVKLCGL